MSAPDQSGFQQRAGYSNQEEYTNGPPQDGYAPQGYSAQQSYGPQGGGTYQGQRLRDNEYVDRKGRVKKRDAGKFAAGLALCWCITWPCHGPCCGGL